MSDGSSSTIRDPSPYKLDFRPNVFLKSLTATDAPRPAPLIVLYNQVLPPVYPPSVASSSSQRHPVVAFPDTPHLPHSRSHLTCHDLSLSLSLLAIPDLHLSSYVHTHHAHRLFILVSISPGSASFLVTSPLLVHQNAAHLIAFLSNTLPPLPLSSTITLRACSNFSLAIPC